MVEKNADEAVQAQNANKGPAPKKVLMEVSDRGIFEYASLLYSDRRTFAREALQNARDSHSTTFDVTTGRRSVTMTDDGTGMSREFLEEKFNKIGLSTKGADDAGEWGVGKLSYFLPILSEGKKGDLRYTGHIEITTNDGKSQTHVNWDSVSKYKVSSQPVQANMQGTSVEIVSDSNSPLGALLGSFPSARSLTRYIQDVAVEVPVRITVNGKVVPTKYRSDFTAQRTAKLSNKQMYEKPTYTFKISVDASSEGLTVAEKGLKIALIEGLPVGGTINFTGGKTASGEKAGVKPLSRDGTLVPEAELKDTFMLDGVVPYYTGMSMAARERNLGKMVAAAAWFRERVPPQWRWSMLDDQDKRASAAGEELTNKIVVRGLELQEWAKMPKVVYSNKDDRIAERAEQLGYTVLPTYSSPELQKIYSDKGITNISSIMQEVLNSFRFREASTRFEQTALGKISAYIDFLDSASGAAAYDVFDKVTKWQKWHARPQAGIPKSVKAVGPGVKCANGLEVHLAEHSDKGVMVFHWENIIAVNMNNPVARQFVESERVDALYPLVALELTKMETGEETGKRIKSRYMALMERASRHAVANEVLVDAKVRADGAGLEVPQTVVSGNAVSDTSVGEAETIIRYMGPDSQTLRQKVTARLLRRKE